MKRYLLLIIPFLLLSCNNRKKTSVKHFIALSMEDNVYVSAKSDFKDTLFYEHKFPDSTKYYYVLLSEKENEELKILVENISTERDTSKFGISTGQELFIVDNGQIRFYINDFTSKTESYKKINYFFKKTSLNMVSTAEIKNFWNIGTVIPPPNPPKKLENVTLKNNGH